MIRLWGLLLSQKCGTPCLQLARPHPTDAELPFVMKLLAMLFLPPTNSRISVNAAAAGRRAASECEQLALCARGVARQIRKKGVGGMGVCRGS